MEWKVGQRIRTKSILLSMDKDSSPVPVGTGGFICNVGSFSITVDFENIVFGKWAISMSIAEKCLDNI